MERSGDGSGAVWLERTCLAGVGVGFVCLPTRAAAENGEGEGPAILQPAVDASWVLGRAMGGPLAWMPLTLPWPWPRSSGSTFA